MWCVRSTASTTTGVGGGYVVMDAVLGVVASTVGLERFFPIYTMEMGWRKMAEAIFEACA